MRTEYSNEGLGDNDLPGDPIELFNTWFEEAKKADVFEPNAMCLSTCGADMKPSSRYVLLKGVDQEGFVFYTNYSSRKSEQMMENGHAAANFWWGYL